MKLWVKWFGWVLYAWFVGTVTVGEVEIASRFRIVNDPSVTSYDADGRVLTKEEAVTREAKAAPGTALRAFVVAQFNIFILFVIWFFASRIASLKPPLINFCALLALIGGITGFSWGLFLWVPIHFAIAGVAMGIAVGLIHSRASPSWHAIDWAVGLALSLAYWQLG